MNENHKPVEDVGSLLLLWLGSAGCAASVSFIAGSSNVLRVTTKYLTHGELEGGKAFAIGMPMLLASGVAAVGVTITIVGLVLSLRRARRRFLSLPHCCALLLIALPAAAVCILR